MAKEIGDVLLALTTGVIVGGIFAFVSQPIPAPATLAGVMGVVGLWLGYAIIISVK